MEFSKAKEARIHSTGLSERRDPQRVLSGVFQRVALESSCENWLICAFEKTTQVQRKKNKKKEKGGKMLRSHTGLGIVHIFTNWKETHVALSGVIKRILCCSEAKFL